jgi:phosphatidylglycerophosphate synthase
MAGAVARVVIRAGEGRSRGLRGSFMGFWSGYRATLKPLEVEEPVDVYLHRPLGYVLARASYALPISPDAITGLSIVAGVASAAALILVFPHHLQVGGLLLFLSAVLDCADGQLARMRGTSSMFGRMLDGTADLFTVGAAAPATAYVIWRSLDAPLWVKGTVLLLACITMVTTSFHTTMYDHYKNVFLRLTGPYQEGEDYEAARRRYRARGSRSLVEKIAFPIYLFYLKNQRDYVMKFDPWTSARLGSFPDYQPGRAAIYRAHAGRAMRLWRSIFGFGSMVFGLALFNALAHPEYYLVYRLVVLNALFYLYMRPLQRRASREAFQQMNLGLPDRTDEADLAFA